ncbi:MAG: hypothetical protein ACLTMP_13560 [Eggerthella lenta]
MTGYVIAINNMVRPYRHHLTFYPAVGASRLRVPEGTHGPKQFVALLAPCRYHRHGYVSSGESSWAI